MTSKIVILGDGTEKEMTFEQILKQFRPMIIKFAKNCVNKSLYNAPDLDDVIQELYIQAWEAWERYDEKHAFSTYLFHRLQHGVHRATQKMYASKRNNKAGVISLNQSLGDESEQELENLLGDIDSDLESITFKHLIIQLHQQLEHEEKLMLKCMLNKDVYSIRDLADDLEISRQGANKKYNKFRKKLEKILQESGYIT